MTSIAEEEGQPVLTSQPPLFDLKEEACVIPDTEGIKYAGSKSRMVPYILECIRDLPVSRVLDGFSGTTRVSQALAKSGYQVTSNDLAVWSEVFGTAYLRNESPQSHYQDLIDHLNSVPPIDGWFTEFYGGMSLHGSAVQPNGLKKPWQVHNTRKLDGIREEIDRLNLSPIERAVALTSLILALDKVDNTLGHFVSYLRNWSPRSFETMILKIPKLWINDLGHVVTRQDVFFVASSESFDLAYFDPPYGSNNEKMPPSRVRYASYYHVWQSICLNDQPNVFGAACRRLDSSDRIATSVFEEFRRDCKGRLIAVEAIRRLLRETSARYILLSYSSGGVATANELDSAIRECGKLIRTVSVNHRRNVMASMRWTHEWARDLQDANTELIFLIEKS